MIAIIATIMAILLVVGWTLIGWRFKLLARLYWRTVAVVCGLLALAVGASWLPLVRADSTQVVTNTDIVFLVDTTYSMNALDGRNNESRLASVRQDIKTFSEKLAGSRFGIVTFDNASTIYLPLTATTGDVAIAADTIQTKPYYESFQDPNMTKALESTKAYLDEVAKVDVTRQRLLVVMTDGELTGSTDTAAKVQAAATTLAASVDKTVVLGYGTDAGAKMPQLVTDFKSFTQKQALPSVSDFTNNVYGPVISKRDTGFLQALATSFKGTYVDFANAGDAFNALAQGRQAAASAKSTQPESRALLQNILHVPAAGIILAFLVLFELLGWRRLRQLVAKGKIQ